MNIWLSFNKAITLWPKSEALVDGDFRLTYAEFGQCVLRLVASLHELGLKKGDVVAISSPNSFQYMEIYYACGISGIILVPLNYRLANLELAEILIDAEAKLLFCHEIFKNSAHEITNNVSTLEHLVWIENHSLDCSDTSNKQDHRVDSIYKTELTQYQYENLCQGKAFSLNKLPYIENNELAHLYYTSGTTGRPKGVMLSHGNVAFNSLGVIAEIGLNENDNWLHVAPLFHLADAWSTFAITWVGGKHTFLPQFQASETLKIFHKEKITATVLVPTMLNAILNDSTVNNYTYESLRLLITGGSPIAPEIVKKAIKAFECEYIQLYGMTETSPFLTISKPKAEMLLLPENEQIELRCRTGRPYIGAEVRVVKENGDDVEANNLEVGEIIARGPTITKGYWKQSEATNKTIKNGWIHTGDLAVIDKYGYINIVDRQKDMIITGGENVYSTEVEYAIFEHPSVHECAVFGIPDDRWGEAVHAVVVLKPSHELIASELISFVRERIAHYKAPRSIEFRNEIPKTGSGKIYKKGLRETFWQGRIKQVN